jgi:hypothetical protein
MVNSMHFLAESNTDSPPLQLYHYNNHVVQISGNQLMKKKIIAFRLVLITKKVRAV